ncbi:MAG TPA: 4-alpha-glucanotransferase [Actinomycetota bacterium]
MTTVRRDPIDPGAWGIQTTYRNYKDEPRVAPFATVAKILSVMDADTVGPPAPGAHVVRAGEIPDVAGATLLTLEDGSSIAVGDEWPKDVPLGYHEVTYRDGHATRLIVTPAQCRPADTGIWGWALQLYALRSRSSWGIGDLADLRKLGTWARRTGAAMLLVNPLHAAEPGEPQQPSPYYPSSRRFRNPLYLRIEEIPGAPAVDIELMARDGRALNEMELIDRDAVARAKNAALEAIWSGWAGSPEFDTYVVREGSALDDFATYMSLHEGHGEGPSAWPPEYAHPDSPAVVRWRDDHADRIRFHKWVQWLLDEQLARAGKEIGLVHDLAIGIDPHGADAWLWQDYFARGVRVGAPPDEFNARGQDWGLPPFDPWKLRGAGYEPFIATIRAAFAHGAGLRIDHVMGLFRLYWLPEGVSPADGTYVRYPHDDLLGIVALESERAGAYVIGEDLGTVEDNVRDEMGARRMLSYKLGWFEDRPADQYPELALAAMTNHDLPTVAGVWTGADLDEQLKLGLDPDTVAAEGLRLKLEKLPGVTAGQSPATVARAAYRELARAPSAVLAATFEDALGVERRPNLPGTIDERPNWRMRLPLDVEQLERDEDVNAIARILERRTEELDAAERSRSLEPVHHHALIGDVRLHYVEAGEGPLVVLLHGFPDFWYSWRKQIPTLASAGFRVVAVDMRGYNESDKPDGVGAYGIQQLVDDVDGLIEHLGEERAHVVGHDWGGVVAWNVAMRRPERVDRLAILNAPHPRRYVRSLPSRQALKSWYMLFFQLPWLPERVLSFRDYEPLRRILATTSNDREEVEEYVAAARRSNGLHYPLNYYRSLARADSFKMLRWSRPVTRPVLVLWGDQDVALEPHTADPGPAWADATVHHFPHAGHWVHLDDPDGVNAALIDFLSAAE